MASKSTYQTTFEVQRVIEPIYTGGSVALDTTGRILATCLGEDALITDLNTGKQLARIEGVGMSVTSLSFVADRFTRMASSFRPLPVRVLLLRQLATLTPDSNTFCVASNRMLEIIVYVHILPQAITICADQHRASTNPKTTHHSYCCFGSRSHKHTLSNGSC